MAAEEAVTFCHDGMPRMCFLAFQEMRKNRELCDLTIKIQNRTIEAHRVVLAAAIPYFRSLFIKDTGEMEGKEIAMANLDPGALESLIHFAYSSKVNISFENVYSLLLASEFLQILEVMDACVEFLSERLYSSNVNEVCILAQNLNNQKLIEHCNVFMQQNFEEFSKSTNFLCISYPCIRDVISGDKLNVSNEETVFEAVMDWVKFAPEGRQNVLPDLLKEVRMTALPIGYLIKRVATEELINASTACRDIIQKVQSFHLLPKEETAFLNLNTVPRTNVKKQIYAFCDSASHQHSLYRCDFANEKWEKVTLDKSHRAEVYRIAAANENLYIFLQKTIKTFNLKSLEWKVLQPTHDHIEGSAILAERNLIYFFGSLNSNFFDKVRSFDTQQKKWLKETKMETGRANTAVTSLKEFIYVTGGYWNLKTFKVFQKFCLSTGLWSDLSPMLASRSLHGCASIDEKIYVFGGCSKRTSYVSYSNSSEVYDTLTNIWSSVALMNTGRNRFSFVSHCGKIYAFGGRTETESVSRDVEFYDPECNKWKSSFNVLEGFFTAVVM